MDNHQRELAIELDRNNYCYSSDTKEFKRKLKACLDDDREIKSKLPDPIDPQILFNKIFSN